MRTIKAYGQVGIYIHMFLISAVDGCEWVVQFILVKLRTVSGVVVATASA